MARNHTLVGLPLLAGLAACLCAAPAWSQVAPPPPDAPAKTPDYTPPPQPKVVQPPASNPKSAPPDKSFAKGKNETLTEPVFVQAKEKKIKLPDAFDATVLIKRDDQGKVIRYDRPVPWVALELNPLIPADQQAEIAKVMPRRNLQHEVSAVNNLDLIMRVDQGEFDRLDPRNRRELTWAERSVKLLRAGGMLSEWLNAQGLVTPEQALASQTLGDAYGKSLLEEARIAAGEDKAAMSTLITREIFKQRIDEPLFVYRQLLVQAANNVDTCLGKTEMPDEVRKTLDAEVAAVKSASTDLDKRQAVHALLNKMPDWVMQHQFMDAAIDTQFLERSARVGDKSVTAVMAYKMEQNRRNQAAANGKPAEYQKTPLRPN